MARPRDEAKRVELLDGVIDYIAVEGLSQLSLRPLAERLGTSARMLLHYFGTKEQLLIEALTALRPDARRDFTTSNADLAGTPESRASLGALLQVLAAATVPGSSFADYALDAVRVPIADVASVLQERYELATDPAVTATLLVSGLRGLVLDLLITGDEQRVNAAADQLVAAVIPCADTQDAQAVHTKEHKG
ncbi:TetR/AcrR family transcriptional regulator [Jongsikchunia kroppenstedtii]|uniref:TetR/AcrR family transcriptional regulator n=1 Tax=Jongsikchunia kroppenstedtii TaxID=1121721 RepID=UPI00036072B5|nr:TetR/AcrR family transcriptional regulator [Jongsikchunia kroppenstedtii]